MDSVIDRRSVTPARAQSLGPTLPLRDPMEDTDGSVTRKRPRLDSGDRSYRSMSADPPHPSPSAKDLADSSATIQPTMTDVAASAAAGGQVTPSTTLTPSKVTINVRDSSLTTHTTSLSSPSKETSTTTGPSGGPAASSQENADTSAVLSASSSPLHSPEIEVAEVEDMDGGPTETRWRPIGDSDFTEAKRIQDDLLSGFPFWKRHHNILTALEDLSRHLEKDDMSTNAALQGLAVWMEQYLDSTESLSSHWWDMYIDLRAFWDMFPTLMKGLLGRSNAKLGTARYIRSSGNLNHLHNFLVAFAALALRMARIDEQTLKDYVEEADTTPDLMSEPWLYCLATIVNYHAPFWRSTIDSAHYERYCTIAAIVKRLASSPFDGVKCLTHISQMASTQNPLAKVWYPSYIVHTIYDYYRNHCEDEERTVLFGTLPSQGYEYFLDLDSKLQNLICKQNAALTMDICQGLVERLDNVLTAVVLGDDSFALKVLETAMPPTPNVPVDLRPSLAIHAWKIGLLKRCMMEGRMEIRVYGVDCMQNCLVEAYSKYIQAHPNDTSHPIAQYLSDWLLANRIVEYFVGVESHPQLIQRASNIIGFLIVTSRYSDAETDVIWNAVNSGRQDPTKTEAILNMARGFFGISTYPILLYLSEKMIQVPLSGFDGNMITYGKGLLLQLRDKWRLDLDHRKFSMMPYHLSIRLIRESTADKSLATSKRQRIKEWASSELSTMLQFDSINQDLGSIYKDCLNDIAEHTEFATGSVYAINAICMHKPEDVKLLAQNANLTELLVSDLAHVSKTESSLGSPSQTLLESLDIRLRLLEILIITVPESISTQLAKDLWDVTVGHQAFDNEYVRNVAWGHLRSVMKATSRNPFIMRCIDEFLPELLPACYVRTCIIFARDVNGYRLRSPESQQQEQPRDIQGRTSEELLWQISLATPQDKPSIANMSINSFIALHLDSPEAHGRSRAANDAVHIDLVERCIRHLTSAASKLKSFNDGTSSGEDEPMIIVASEEEVEVQKLSFARSLRILQEFVHGIRSRPMYSPEPQAQPLLPKNFHVIRGEPVKLLYQSFSASKGGTEIRTIEVGNRETVEELSTRLKTLTGFANLTVIAGGQKLDFTAMAGQTIGDLGLHQKGLLLVRKAESPDAVPDLAPMVDLRPVEVEILSHFTELYQLLGLEENLAKQVYAFLVAFSPHQTITARVCSPATSLEKSFPPAAPYKILYSTFALRGCLAHQLDHGAATQSLLDHSIRVLTATITTLNLDQLNLSVEAEVTVASALVECLLAFMKEPAAFDKAPVPFLDPRALVDRLQSWINRTLGLTATFLEARKLVAECFAALLEASMHSATFRQSFVEAAGLAPLLQSLLLEESVTKSREGVGKIIQSTCSNSPKASAAPHDLITYLWDSIVVVIPKCLGFDHTSEQFFDVANTVFQTIDSARQEHLDLDDYMQGWCSLLLKHTHIEFVGRDEIDHIVLGLSRLILYCFQLAKPRSKPLRTPDNFMEALFRKHLFPEFSGFLGDAETEPQVPNLHTGVRTELLSIISLLSNEKASYYKLLTLIRDLIPPFEPQQEDNQAWSYGFAQIGDNCNWDPNWNFERAKAIRAPAGHPGLRNLSNTCYMNSLLTQLFMNVKFREFILNTHVSDHNGAQRLLQETKKLFAYLQETFLKSVDTHGIADSVKTYENTIIDVTVQMDVDEFYNLLFDRWESQILDDAEKKKFRRFYGGQLIQQIKSRECPHISERSEPFSAIQCDITGKNTLMESLDAYVTGEVMEGDNKYSCTSCGCYVEAEKRACLKDIPDNLIFHLKRFDFDLMTGQRSKLNTRFEFPREIDMAPYHVDKIMHPQQNITPDVFELVGVLIHTGTAESGHYYSYIKERPSPESTANIWVDFNDTEVTYFDPASIDDNCFGGWTEPTMYYSSAPKGYNAYMLFYERMTPDAPGFTSANIAASGTPARCKVPADLKVEVDYSNVFFLRQYCLFDPAYANFTRNTLDQLRTVNKGTCTDDHSIERESISIALDYLDRYHSRTKDCPGIDQMLATLTRVVGTCSQCCKLGLQWVIQNPDGLRNLLLRCPYPKVRRDFAAMIATGLQYLRNTEPQDYGFEQTDEIEPDVLDTPIQILGSKVFPGVVSGLIDLFHNIHQTPRGWDDYFGLLAEIANVGKPETHVLLRGFPSMHNDYRCGTLHRCLELLVADSEKVQKTHRFGDDYAHYCRLVEKGRKFPMGKLIELVSNLFASIDLEKEALDVTCYHRRFDSGGMALTSDEDTLIRLGSSYNQRSKDSCIFVDKILTNGSNPQAIQRILRTLLLAEPALTLQLAIFNTIKAGISVDPAVLAAPYLRAAIAYCECVPQRRDAETMIKFVAHEVDSIGRSGGKEHLDFFITIRRSRSLRHDVDPESFERAVLHLVPTWAPGLLSYFDENVRSGTLELLKILIFNYDHENLDDEEEAESMVKAGKELCIQCARKCELEVKRGEPLENPKAWEQVVQVVRHCMKTYSDEDFQQHVKPIGDILDGLEALSVSDAEDPPSDHWNGSDGEMPTDSDSDNFAASP